jgi:hypothetical protein
MLLQFHTVPHGLLHIVTSPKSVIKTPRCTMPLFSPDLHRCPLVRCPLAPSPWKVATGNEANSQRTAYVSTASTCLLYLGPASLRTWRQAVQRCGTTGPRLRMYTDVHHTCRTTQFPPLRDASASKPAAFPMDPGWKPSGFAQGVYAGVFHPRWQNIWHKGYSTPGGRTSGTRGRWWRRPCWHQCRWHVKYDQALENPTPAAVQRTFRQCLLTECTGVTWLPPTQQWCQLSAWQCSVNGFLGDLK